MHHATRSGSAMASSGARNPGMVLGSPSTLFQGKWCDYFMLTCFCHPVLCLGSRPPVKEFHVISKRGYVPSAPSRFGATNEHFQFVIAKPPGQGHAHPAAQLLALSRLGSTFRLSPSLGQLLPKPCRDFHPQCYPPGDFKSPNLIYLLGRVFGHVMHGHVCRNDRAHSYPEFRP
jgi:hypothetical protein